MHSTGHPVLRRSTEVNCPANMTIWVLFVYLFIYPNRQRRNPFADEVIAKITVA